VIKRLAPILAVTAVLILAGCSGPGSGPGTPANPAKPPKHSGTPTGCDIVTAAEVSKISGVTFHAGVSVKPTVVAPTKDIPVILNQSCSYKNGDNVYVEYFLNTLSTPAAAYEATAWKADMIEEPSSIQSTVAGLPALEMTQGSGDAHELIFYKGQVVVQINVEGVSDHTEVDVAGLIASRM
jgi:hypothetical protein